MTLWHFATAMLGMAMSGSAQAQTTSPRSPSKPVRIISSAGTAFSMWSRDDWPNNSQPRLARPSPSKTSRRR